MSASSKVILAIVGLLVGTLIVYYGFLLPDPTAGAGIGVNGEAQQNGIPVDQGPDAPGTLEAPVVIEPEASTDPPFDEFTSRPQGMLSSALQRAEEESTSSDLTPPTETLAVLPRENSPVWVPR